nr:MAG TPA_asm: Fluorescent protein lanFP6A Protein Branchiostoma floridae Gly-Tyr-Ala.35A [Caudoviricetes sp.]
MQTLSLKCSRCPLPASERILSPNNGTKQNV